MRSMTRFLNSGKLRQPEEPASTMVVTPLRRVKPSGARLQRTVVVVLVVEAPEDVGVEVDEAGCDVESGDVDGLDGGVGGDAYGDFGDLAVLDGYVTDGVDVVLGVDDVAAFEQEVVVFRGGGVWPALAPVGPLHLR